MKTKNEAYKKTITLLRDKGYGCIRWFEAKTEDAPASEDHFEVWVWAPEGGGNSKMILLQVWKDGNGVAVYSNAGLGYTFEELEKAL